MQVVATWCTLYWYPKSNSMKRAFATGNALRTFIEHAPIARKYGPACCCRSLSTSLRLQKASTSSELPTPRPDFDFVVDNQDKAARNVALRKSPVPSGHTPESLVKEIASLYSKVKALRNDAKELRGRRNALSQVWADKGKSNEEKVQAKYQAEVVRYELLGGNGKKGLETTLVEAEADLLALGIQLPNETSPESPPGGYEACQVVELSPSASAVEAHPAADHVDLLTKLGWLYLPSHITGSSWPYLLKGGALLEMALTQYAISQAVASGYELVLPPDVVKSEIMRRCGFNPRDAGGEAQTYFVSTSSPTSDDASGKDGVEAELALAATSEVPLAAYFMKSKFSIEDLPKKVLAFGHAFRAEAGARGRESRGLYRVHQFSKVELFSVTSSEEGQSAKMLENMTKLQWKILSGLNLPLRLMNMSTEELGASAYRKFDIEAWMPGRGSWGELASASNCTAYQARRLDIKHAVALPEDSANARASKTAFCHTLNATAVAIPRVIVALIENGARFDSGGKWVGLTLPKVLRPFWLGKEAQLDSLQVSLPGSGKKAQGTIELKWE